MEALVAWTLVLAAQQPLVMLYEDLHWCDPSTVELLGLLLAQSPTAPVLTLLTFRPSFVPPWPARSHLTTVQLARLTKRQARAVVASVVSLDTRSENPSIRRPLAPTQEAATRDDRFELVGAQPNPFTPSSGPSVGPRIEGPLPEAIVERIVERADGVPLSSRK